MYLKQLELTGFKSFPHKTTVSFADGVTAIVGPNGCGKTNILDALRWVLGEQRPTLLRGGKMEEVIFNGTRDLKPLGMSEATLTVINDRGVLPTDYHEVQITRRLFRSGESEYLLNKVPCRLKDITDLFVDTGMGSHSYSVIQQDMIEAVISDKADERRFLFEEAAGITKYKQRRKAAMRKLEATENDFLRLRDIHSEVRSRVLSLQRQQKKAERYIQLRDEIRSWEGYLAAQRLSAIDTERRSLAGELQRASEGKLRAGVELDQAGAELEEARRQLTDLTQQVSQLADQLLSINSAIHETEREQSVLQTRRTSSQEQIAKDHAEIELLTRRAETLSQQLLESQGRVRERETALTAVLERVREQETVHTTADASLWTARSNRDRHQQELAALSNRLTSGRTEETTLKTQGDEIRQQIEALVASEQVISPLLQSIQEKARLLDEQLSTISLELNTAESRRAELLARIEKLTLEIDDYSQEQSQVMASIEACDARRKLLEEMMLHYEGHEAGTIATMEQRERWPGIVGTVAETFVPNDGMEAALTGALGELSKYLICDSKSTAESIIGFLKAERKGQIGIIVPTTGTIAPTVKRPELPLDGIVGWLDDFVTSSESIRQLKELVLSRTVVFRSDVNPETILNHLPYGFSAVSMDGVCYASTVIRGGSDDRPSLFRRRERVDEQIALRDKLTSEQQKLEHLKQTAVIDQAAARAELTTLTSRYDELRDQRAQCDQDRAALVAEERGRQGEFDRLARDKAALQQRLDSIHERQLSLELDYSDLTTRHDELTVMVNSERDSFVEVERAASVALTALANLRLEEAGARSQFEQTETELRHLTEVAAEIDRTRTSKELSIANAQSSVAYFTAQLAILDTTLAESFAQRDTLTSQQTELRAGQAVHAQSLQQIESRVNEIRQSREKASDTAHKLELQVTGLQNEANSLVERMLTEHELNLREHTPTRPVSDLTDEAAAAQLAELRDRLKGLGMVNLLALEEFREASEREKFLSEQIADLTTARNDLETTITRINQTAKQLFDETLDKVRTHFQRLFVELFAGGESDVRLENPDDPLESNIEIIARPRGKKLMNITMMSGGERALTAIALLFSLYLVKPSPFCILDEIDAPLDDANCRRFLNIIRSFSNQTQFITITHNKITMEAADNLYGVTMEQPGVSKLVAVRFTGPEQGAEIVTDAEAETTESPSLPDQDIPASIRKRMTAAAKVADKPTIADS